MAGMMGLSSTWLRMSVMVGSVWRAPVTAMPAPFCPWLQVRDAAVGSRRLAFARHGSAVKESSEAASLSTSGGQRGSGRRRSGLAGGGATPAAPARLAQQAQEVELLS